MHICKKFERNLSRNVACRVHSSKALSVVYSELGKRAVSVIFEKWPLHFSPY